MMGGLKYLLITLAASLSFTAIGGAARAGEAIGRCAPRAAFASLNANIAAMPPAAALAKLEAYQQSDAHDPNVCGEGLAVAGLIEAREKSLVALVTGGRSWHPDAVYRCNDRDGAAAECSGIVADMTAHPEDADGGFDPVKLTRAITGRLGNGLPSTKVVAAYRADIGGLVRGDATATVPLPFAPLIRLTPPRHLSALVVILSAPAPVKYRKLVWYYR